MSKATNLLSWHLLRHTVCFDRTDVDVTPLGMGIVIEVDALRQLNRHVAALLQINHGQVSAPALINFHTIQSTLSSEVVFSTSSCIDY